MIERYNLPGYAVGVGSKGCVTFSPTKIVDYETFKANQDQDLSELAWLWNMNRGIFMTPGREEEWTLSVTHTRRGGRRLRERVRRDGARADGVTGPRGARAGGAAGEYGGSGARSPVVGPLSPGSNGTVRPGSRPSSTARVIDSVP